MESHFYVHHPTVTPPATSSRTVRRDRGELAIDQMRVSRGFRVGCGGADLLASEHTLEARVTHQSSRLIPADLQAYPVRGFPELPGSIDPVVLGMQAHQLRDQLGTSEAPR